MPRPIPLVDPVTSATRPLSGLPWRVDESGAGLDEAGMFHHHGTLVNLVDQDAAQRVDVAVPGLLLDRAPDIVVAGLPAPADAIGAEVDVLGVVLAIEPRR
jgi:hypothetical protein